MVPLERTPYCWPRSVFTVMWPFEWTVTSPAGSGLRLIPLMFDRVELSCWILACDSLDVSVPVELFADGVLLAGPLGAEGDDDRGAGLLLAAASAGAAFFL